MPVLYANFLTQFPLQNKRELGLRLPRWQRSLTAREEGEESERPLPAFDVFFSCSRRPHLWKTVAGFQSVLLTVECACPVETKPENF